MAEPAPDIIKKTSGPSSFFKIRVAAVGLAQDFWNDGDTLPSFLSFLQEKDKKSVQTQTLKTQPLKQKPQERKLWQADRIQILEKMWGAGCVNPASEDSWNDLSAPLGLTSEMSVLDLAAGLGGLPRYIADTYGSYVTGMEADQLLAARGMILSIAAGKSKHASVTPYDPSIYTASRKFDCVFATELFYRVIGKEDFFKTVNDSLKNGGGQLVFTDFLLEPEDREKPAIKKWLETEENASPMALVEVNKQWKGMGYDVRTMEDQTEAYKVCIINGLARFVEFISKEKIEPETKARILDEIEHWALRYAALKEGLKYYRVSAIKR